MKIHVHKAPIVVPYGGQFKIIAISDIHYGAAACHLKRFENNVLRANAKDQNAYFICIGDALDLIGPRDPRYRPGEGCDYEDFIDKTIDGFTGLFKKYNIPPERILGFGVGNHEDSIRKFYGTDPVNRICRELGTTNLGFMFALKLNVRIRNSTRKLSMSLCGHHGFAGGRKEGSSVNAYIDWVHRHPGHHVYLFGHNHKKWFHKVPTVEIDFTKREQLDRSVLVGNTGTYLKTYAKGEVPTYSEKKGFYPVEIGHLEIHVRHVSEELPSVDGKRRQRNCLDIRGME